MAKGPRRRIGRGIVVGRSRGAVLKVLGEAFPDPVRASAMIRVIEYRHGMPAFEAVLRGMLRLGLIDYREGDGYWITAAGRSLVSERREMRRDRQTFYRQPEPLLRRR